LSRLLIVVNLVEPDYSGSPFVFSSDADPQLETQGLSVFNLRLFLLFYFACTSYLLPACLVLR